MADPTGKETVEPGMNEKTSQSSENGDELKKLDSKIAIPDKQEDDFEAALNEVKNSAVHPNVQNISLTPGCT